ncbi:MAG: LemA family protein [Phycisphaerales bacterium]|nr:MAG: LemA family protein [Phycisphaerales bacterium]
MNIGKTLTLTFVSLVVGVLIVGGCAYSGYKNVIGLDEAVKSQWAQVDNQLQRRFELVPNLVATVKGFAAHEQEVFESIANARAAYAGAQSTGQKAEAAGMFESALSRLLVIQERYPELRSNESFLKLQDSLEGTENRLAVARMDYNEAVRAINARIRAVPGKWYASWAGVEQAEYFEAPQQAREVPKVDFGG